MSPVLVIATGTVTGQVVNSLGLPVAGLPVIAKLNAGVSTPQTISPVGQQVPGEVAAFTDPTGAWSLALVPNNNINPANTTYTIQIPGMPDVVVQLNDTLSHVYTTIAVNPTTAILSPAGQTVAQLTVTGELDVTGPGRFAGPDPWFDVRHPSFGAKGDGVTDDTVAIQAAETAAAVNGGTVYFPPGTYMAAGIVKQSNADWLGAGIGSTTLKLKNNAPTGTPLVISQGFTGLTGTNSTAGIFACDVSRITFDGNKANNATHAVPLIQLYGYGLRFHHYVIQNANNVGRYNEWANDGTGPVQFPGFECHEHNWAILNCGGAGVPGMQWNGPHDSILADGQVEGCGRGVHLMSKGGGAVQFRNVHCWGANQDWSWYLEDSCYLTGCEGEDGTAGAMWVRTAGAVQYNGGSLFLTGVGIRLGVTAGAAATKCSFVGVQISGCTSAAIDFQNDGGGNSIDFYTSGSANAAISTGTQAATTVISRVNGNGLREWITQNCVATLALNDNSANGPTLQFRNAANQKTLRLNNGNLFQILNAAQNANLWQLDDFGTVYMRGALGRGLNSIAFAASIAPNLNNGDYIKVGTLTGAITINAPTGNVIVAGFEIDVQTTQDATGGRVVTYAGAMIATGTGIAAASTAANTTTIDTFRFDGTNWRIKSRVTGQ